MKWPFRPRGGPVPVDFSRVPSRVADWGPFAPATRSLIATFIPPPDLRGPPTEVHMAVYADGVLPILIRMRQPEDVDAVIRALELARADVWPDG